MLTERKEIGMISLLADGQIQIRTDTVIERDGVEVSRVYHREVLDPAIITDSSKYDTRIQKMIAIFWNDDVIEKRKKWLEQEDKRMNLQGQQNGRTSLN